MSQSKHTISAPLWSWRRASILGFLIIFIYCIWSLGLTFIKLPPSADPVAAAKTFFSAALSPTLTDQNPSLPLGTEPFIERIIYGIANTLRYAFIAMSMAVPSGLILGFLASKAWWPTRHSKQTSFFHSLLRTGLFGVYLSTRFLITFMRSIHELIWMLLFLAALGGDSTITACIALALPFSGTLAKVFSEIIDEQNDDTSKHLSLSGGSNIQAFLSARFPEALPDLLTYTLYRLECAIRSSAVLGFLGAETIGLAIQQSYENNYYNEVWTELYLLILTVMFFDIIGSTVRKRLNKAPLARGQIGKHDLKTLKKNTPRWKLLPTVWITLGLGVIAAWFCGDDLYTYYSSIGRLERTQQFFTQLIPEPVKVSGSWPDIIDWAHDLWSSSGQEALASTVIMATAALLLAALIGYAFVPWASRNIATSMPFSIGTSQSNWLMRALWASLGFCCRMLFLVCRSIPEYIIAFLLIGILGAHAWPIVFALAIHNFGILGRLWSEVGENHDESVAKLQMLRGGSRLQAYLCGILPTSYNRQLLFIFYRWETCVRESTILGMLSISSLGYYISIEASFLRYDRMMFFILLGTATIFASDLLSVYLRTKLRES